MTQAARDRTEYVEISGTAAERAAFDSPKQAMEWYETDTTARYKYMSGAWISIAVANGAAAGSAGGASGVIVSSTASTYTNGLITRIVETSAAIGKTRTTDYGYTNGLLSSTTIGNWV